jgi:hypothetical protein
VICGLALVVLSGCSSIVESTAPVGNLAAASPLDEFLNSLGGTDLSYEERRRRTDADNSRRIELITECMRDLGFEFDFFNQPDGMMTFMWDDTDPDDTWQRNSREWVEYWGYGITRNPGGNHLTGGLSRTDRPLLGASELIAFSSALSGVGIYGDPGFVEGCVIRAHRIFDSESPVGLIRSEEFAPLFDSITQMRRDLLLMTSDADRDWEECMANAGYSGFARQWEAADSVRASFQGHLSDKAIENLAARERALAIVDLDCRQKTNFDVRFRSYREEAELIFIDDHREQLLALRAAAEQRSAAQR